MMRRLVSWKRSEEGFVYSHCNRFSIVPLYCGTTRAQMYEARDNITGRRWTADTQSVLKAECDDIVRDDIRRGFC